MPNFRELFVALTLISIFTVGIIIMGAQMAADNNANVSIGDDPIINESFSDMIEQIDSSRTITSGQSNATSLDVPEEGGESILIFSTKGTGIKFMSLITGTYNIIANSASRILGINPIIFNVIATILVATMIFLLWQWLRSGR